MSEDVLKKYGKGAALMMKMGYVQGTGLGENGQGIVEPILPSIYKRGEGIKVNGTSKKNTMQSRVVDDWDSGSDSETNDDSDSEADVEKSKVPLGFKKSGLYQSEYDMPELSDLVRRLRELSVEVPFELIEWVESMDPDDVNSPVDLELRKTLWDILKNVQADIPKIKYLNFEINNIEQFNEKCKLDLEILHRCYTDISMKNIKLKFNNTVVKDILGIERIEEASIEAKFAVLKLVASKIMNWWERQVKKCNFQDISKFGELLDYASAYIELSDKIGVDKTIMRDDVDEDGEKVVSIKFSIIGSVILKPLFLKLGDFYSEWMVENVNLGVGIFEELRESQLLEPGIFEFVVFERMIVPQLVQAIEEWDLTKMASTSKVSEDEARGFSASILEWLKIYPKSCDVIKQQVITKYCVWIMGSVGDRDLTFIDLKRIGLYYWLDVFQDEKYNEQVDKALLCFCVGGLRKGSPLQDFKRWQSETSGDGPGDGHDGAGHRFFSEEVLSKIALFTRRMINLKLDEYNDVVYNEIALPFLASYLVLYQREDTKREGYLRQFVRTCSVLGMLDDDRCGFSCIIEALRGCYELEEGGVEAEFKLEELAAACEGREEDWRAVVARARRSSSDASGGAGGGVSVEFAESVGRKSIKEIVFERLEAAGVSIVPCGEKQGKQLYVVNGRRRVYFENKVVFEEDGFPLRVEEVVEGDGS